MTKVKNEDTFIREELARDRTTLANERTFLAYIRTALMLLASGITMIMLFNTNKHLIFFGYALISIAIVVSTLGFVRFVKMRSRIDKIGKD